MRARVGTFEAAARRVVVTAARQPVSGSDETGVAIIGGGFSGTLLAINLLRHEGQPAVLFEKRGAAGRGLAYAAPNAVHLLNVRAANMSAFPDDKGHFVRWLENRGAGTPGCFAPRETYGQYLCELLDEARAAAPGRLAVEDDEVVAISPLEKGYALHLASGRQCQAGTVVLAMGNLPPRPLPNIDPAELGQAYLDDPWGPALVQGLGRDDTVLLLGTGLTAIDVTLLLVESGFEGKVVAISRRGLLPRRHDESAPPLPLRQPPPANVLAILRHVRAQSRVLGWRQAIDQLRPYSQTLWQKMPLAERQRFLRHVRPWWDVHRHRLAPEVAARVDAHLAEGGLKLLAGRIIAAEPDGQGAKVSLSLRSGGTEVIRTRRIINCTGPSGDMARAVDPLVASLREQKLAHPDALGLGLAADHVGRVLRADDSPDPRLFAVGPLTRGTFWEITAVPDIRLQVWALARRLSNAHWVGGEGL